MSSSHTHTHTHLPSNCSTLLKIHRIQKPTLTSEEQPSQQSTNASSPNLLPQADYLNIYKGLTVLFVGDNSIRTLYRDLCKVLKFGRLLEYTEAAYQNGNYKCIEGETKLKGEVRIGIEDYEDIRQFDLPNNSIKLIYIYLSSLLNDKISIDVVIFCSFTSDINSKKLQQSNASFDAYFNNYLTCLQKFSANLTTFCKETYKSEPYFCWMSPLLPNLPGDTKIDFKQFIDDIDNIVKNEGFLKFDHFDIWSRRQDLVIVQHGHFSLHGIREINDYFAKTLAITLKRSFTPSIAMTPTPLMYFGSPQSSFMANQSNRFHPYQRS